MKKKAIGIIDMSFEGFNVLNGLVNKYRNDDFIYINDQLNSPYEGKEEEVIVELIKKNVERLMEYEIKFLIVVSDTIIEYGSEYLSSLNLPVVDLVNSFIEYVNELYELKNMMLLAKKTILDTNMYQKKLKYNHLYNIASDDLMEIMDNNLLKTSKSFQVTSDKFQHLSKRDIDILISSSPYLVKLKTEILEYLKIDQILEPSEAIIWKIDKIIDKNIFTNKGKGKLIVVSDLTKKDILNQTKWSNIKFTHILLKKFDLLIDKEQQ